MALPLADKFNSACGVVNMKIEKKQITLLILTVCALGFLVWQFFRLIGDDLSAQDRASYAIAQARNTVIAQKKQILEQPQTQPTTATPPTNNNPYVRLVDQYQMLQMEHKLLTEQLEIAKLKAKIATLNKENTSMLNTAHPENYSQSNALYQLVYLAQQNHQWTATILKGNQYKTVNTGDKLANGDHVLQINAHGVILKNPKQRIQLTFNGVGVTALKSKHPKTHPLAAKNKNSVNEAPKTSIANLAQAEQSLYKGHLPNGAKITHNAPYTLDEVLLLELPPSNYTIQLAEDNRLNDLKKLVNRFHLNPRAMLFHYHKNTQMQHVLLLGSYQSKKEAAIALAKLPSELKLLTPQIISLRSVQQVIKAMR